MQIGALVPLGDIGGDPVVVRDYAQQMEGMGYDFLEAPEVVGRGRLLRLGGCRAGKHEGRPEQR